MLTQNNFTGLRVTVFSHQKDGNRVLELARRFADGVRLWFPGAEVLTSHGPSLSVDVRGLDDRTRAKVKARLESQAKLYRYLDELVFRVADVDAKFRIQRIVLEEICANYEKIEFAWTFFRLINSALATDVAISLSRIFEKDSQRDDTYNVYDFLQFVKMHLNTLYQLSPHRVVEGAVTLTHEMVAEQISLLDEFDGKGASAMSEQRIKKLMHYRDKIAAHHDKEYFFGKSEPPEELVLMRKDVERLIDAAKQILTVHNLVFLGSTLTIEHPTAEDVKKVFERLDAFEKITVDC
jgi:hypothetical protein